MRRIVSLVLLAFLAASPAAGLTCAPPGMTSEELVAANLESSSTSYDLAVVGRVISTTTDMSEGDTHGRTYVEMSVAGVFGSTADGTGIVVTTPDPGWMSGFPFEEGKSYFVPVVVSGPSGEANFVSACDAVEEVADPEATAAHLADVAAENGVDFTFPISSSGSGALVTVVFVVVLGALLYWTVKMRQASRRRLNATDSDHRRPPGPRR